MLSSCYLYISPQKSVKLNGIFFIQNCIFRFLSVVYEMKYCHLQLGFILGPIYPLFSKNVMRHWIIEKGLTLQYFLKTKRTPAFLL